MTGWEPEQPHRKSSLVVLIPDVLALFTPCHGSRLFFPQDQATPGARFDAVCQDCRHGWVAELHADSTAEFGLRTQWSEREVNDG